VDFLNRNQFFLRKLHSLTGIVPLGLFLLEHLYMNSFAVMGESSFNRAVNVLHSLPYLWVLELLLIVFPLAFHGLYGFWIMLTGKNEVLRYAYYRNIFFYLQRVSAVIVVAFVIWHVYTLRLSSLVSGVMVTFNDVTASFSNPFFIVFYIVGVVAAVFHFTNGIATFLMTWGFTIGEKSQKTATVVSGIFFIILVLVSFNAGAAFLP